MGGMPEPCFGGVEVGEYVKRHNPFAYYDSVAANPDRCRKVVPLRRLASDLRAGSLPTVAVVIPGQCENTHDCDVGAGDRFLARAVPPLLRALGPHGYLVVTWDEGATDAGCCGGSDGGRIATTVVGPDVQPGVRDGTPVDHYGVLGTIEDSLGLPRLGEARSGRHGDLEGLFVRPPVLC
jgi:phosphatidylinositol-3-phosphatase